MKGIIDVHTLSQQDVKLHSHNFFEIVYVLEGSAIQTLEGFDSVVKQGDYFLIDYGSSHSYSKCRDFKIINCLFMPEYIDATLRGCTSFANLITNYLIQFDYSILSKVPANNVFTDTDGSIREFFESLLEEFVCRQAGYVEIMRCNLIKILVLSLRGLYVKNTHRHPATEEIIKHVEENYARSVTLGELSEKLYFSLPYLCNRFQKDMGLSFSQYLQKVRIEKSCRLLAETNLSVTQIAQNVGYADTKHFGKVFKDITNMTPREFKREIKA